MLVSFLFSSTVLAQTFDGYAMYAGKTVTIDMCHQHGGAWQEMRRSEVPDEPSGITSGGSCLMTQITAEGKDGSTLLITASRVTFVFDYNQRVEFAIFDFEFKTWAARDFARNSVKRHMNEYFPGTVERLNPAKDTEYNLRNLPYFFSFLQSRHEHVGMHPITKKATKETVWHLALAISRHRITSYATTAGSGIREEPAVSLDIDLKSSDPLRGL